MAQQIRTNCEKKRIKSEEKRFVSRSFPSSSFTFYCPLSFLLSLIDTCKYVSQKQSSNIRRHLIQVLERQTVYEKERGFKSFCDNHCRAQWHKARISI